MGALFFILFIIISHAEPLEYDNNHYDMESLISEINAMNSTWKAGINERFVGLTKKDIIFQLGVRKENEIQLPIKNINPKNELPDNFDLRKVYPNCQSIQEIRDQGSCGSCWAFSAAEAISDRICIASGQKLQTRISPLHLISCCVTCG